MTFRFISKCRFIDVVTGEHRADVRLPRTSNAMVVRVDEAGHQPNWKEAEIIHEGLSKYKRKVGINKII